MIEEPKNTFKEMSADQNFLILLAGAIIWYLGYFLGPLNGLFASTGFVLVCFYSAVLSLHRPVTQAWPGLLIGGLMQILGYYFAFIPILAPALIVAGGATVVYFAFPLALQRGELPVVTRLQKIIESKVSEREKKEAEKETSEKKEPPSAKEEQ
jgi:hypothetical protein